MNAISIPDAPGWFNGMLNLSLQATLLAGLVWIVLKAVGRWIPPSWRALLWFLVIARVLIPYSPPSAFSLQNFFTGEPNPPAAGVQEAPQDAAVVPPVTVQFETPVETISSYAAPLTPAQTKPIRYTRVLTVIWGGAAFFLIVLLAARGLVIRYRLVRHGLPAPAFILEQLEICRAELRVRYPIRVTASDRIVAPALTGLIPARLIIPKVFAPPQFSISQIRQILLHELAHVQQGHLFLHWLALIGRAIHWFNPAIHFAAIQLRQECELAADAAALKHCNAEERAFYGETILEVLAQSRAPRTALVLGMAEEARHLQQRLRALTANRRAFRADRLGVCGFDRSYRTDWQIGRKQRRIDAN
jgi:beta-lactamase regulating signal transducer with metallopeptidase domain